MSLLSVPRIPRTLSWVKNDENYAYSFNRYFWSRGRIHDQSVEEEVEEEKKEEDASSSEEEGEVYDDNKADPWRPLRKNIQEDLKKTLPERSPTVPG